MTDSTLRLFIPTSERKRSGGCPEQAFGHVQHNRNDNRFLSLSEPRLKAVRALMHAVNGQGHGEVVLRRSGKRLVEATAINLRILTSPVMPAIHREDGPLFTALNYEGLSEEARVLLGRSAILFCPLLGVLSPFDKVPDYRCPVAAQIPNWGSLHQYWKEPVRPVLDRACRSRDVVSFLPSRLAALWTPHRSVRSFTSIQFAQERPDGSLHPEHAGHGGLSGEMIRFLLTKGSGRVESLKKFRSEEGHVYAQSKSEVRGESDTWIFVRKA